MSTPRRPSYLDRIGYQTGLLGGIACLAGAALVIGNITTKPEIALRKAEDLQQSLQQVIPASMHDNNLLEDAITVTSNNQQIRVYRAIKEQPVGDTKQPQIVAFAYEVVKAGYSGDITLIMGLDNHGKIIGVRVLSHTETPGLGDKMETAKDDWIYDFNGLTLGNPPLEKWKVKKDGGQFDQWTGATITPRAVVSAIKEGLVMFQENQQILLRLEPASEELAP